MKKVLFTKNTKLESNTYYYFDKDILEYRKEDTIPLYEREYFCQSVTHSDHHDVCVYINNLENVIIDFNGATLFLYGALQPFIIRDSKNIEIKNLVVKYDRPFYTQMKLVEKGEGYLKCLVDKGFPYEVRDGEFIPYSDNWRDETVKNAYVFMQEFDPATHDGIEWPVVLLGDKTKDRCYLPWGDEACSILAYQEGEYLVFKGHKIPEYNVGSILILCVDNRDISSVTAYNSKDLKFTNYRIINGHGMGLMPVYCENITVDGLKYFYDEMSSSIAANSADGIHAVSSKGDIIIKNSIFNGTIDDALNIHSNFYSVLGTDKNVIKAKTPDPVDFFKIFDKGDEIAIYNGHSMEELYRRKILNIIKLGRFTYEFTLDKEVGEIPEGSLIENMSTQPNVHIDNCSFGKANTHLRFQTRGKVLIENSKTDMDLMTTGDTNYWYESSPVCDMVMRNMYFNVKNRPAFASIPEFRSTEKAPYYHKNITIENSTFTNKFAAYFRFTDNITFKDNVNLSGEKLEIILDHCGTFNTNMDVDVKRTNEKASRDE